MTEKRYQDYKDTMRSKTVMASVSDYSTLAAIRAICERGVVHSSSPTLQRVYTLVSKRMAKLNDQYQKSVGVLK